VAFGLWVGHGVVGNFWFANFVNSTAFNAEFSAMLKNPER
jgi:hypothetical protein